jgi:hypothetical protein
MYRDTFTCNFFNRDFDLKVSEVTVPSPPDPRRRRGRSDSESRPGSRSSGTVTNMCQNGLGWQWQLGRDRVDMAMHSPTKCGRACDAPVPAQLAAVWCPLAPGRRVHGQHCAACPRTPLTNDWAGPCRRGCTPMFLDETAEDDAEEEIVYTVPDKIVFKVALPSAPLLLLEEEEEKEPPLRSSAWALCT